MILHTLGAPALLIATTGGALAGETTGSPTSDSRGDVRGLAPNESPWWPSLILPRSSRVNPALTIVAWALRVADRLAGTGEAAARPSMRAVEAPEGAAWAMQEAVVAAHRSDADAFYADLLPAASAEDHRILRQALAGMIWSKQFFHYDVARWLRVDRGAARRRDRRRQGTPCGHHGWPLAALRLSGAGHRGESQLFRSRRLGALRHRPQVH